MSPVEKVSRVLVGVDFDDASASALKMAGVLDSTRDADITVFHAPTPDAPAYFTADPIETLEAEREQSRAGTAAQVRAVAEEQVQRAVHAVVEEGPPGDALVRMLDALQERARLAQLRFDNGRSAHLEVLDAQRDLFETEQALVQLRRAHLASAIALYAALGGGFVGQAAFDGGATATHTSGEQAR